MRKEKSKKRIVLKVLGIILAVIIFITGYTAYMLTMRINKIDKRSMGSYSIEFNEKGWSYVYGESRVKLVLKKDMKKISETETGIKNGNYPLNAMNWDILWGKNSATVLLQGYRGRSELVKMDYNGKIHKHFISPKEKEDFMKALEGPTPDEKKEEEKYRKEEEEIKKGYSAVFEYLKEKGESLNGDIRFDYTAKGQLYAVVGEKNTEDGNLEVRTIVYNENFNEKGKIEYVLYSEKRDSSGNTVEDKQIEDFYLVETKTMKITDEKRDTW